MTNTINTLLSHARWLLVVFYGGLALALAGYAIAFLHKLWKYLILAPTMDEVDGILGLLGLIDSALVAGLVIMVIQSGYGNFIARPSEDEKSNGDVIEIGALKTKFAATIAAIASIDILEAILDVKNFSTEKILMLALLMGVLLISLLIFAVSERLAKH